MRINADKLLERFLSYVKIDTQSDEASESCPSTQKQKVFGELLRDELIQIGLSQVSMDDNGYIMAELPSNIKEKAPVIGFISHMDTSPDMSAEVVKPQVLRNYSGGDIVLNQADNIILPVSLFPELKNYQGQTIIHTDGTTLLGADDKAGLAEIVTAFEYLAAHPEIPHGTIKAGFTPDEEIGRGADRFDVDAFGADFAYTMDGGPLGELEYENFNAAKAEITIQGRNTHPGTAKGKMLNSIQIAMEMASLLPAGEKPEYTEGYEGFFHLNSLEGSVEKTRMLYIVRDHDQAKFNERKRQLSNCVDFLNQKYGNGTVHLDLKEQYLNMRTKIEPVMHLIETAKEAMLSLGITPVIKPIRGGTDGSRLSYMGLPCPNIFAGGHNFHGKFEYVPLESMVKATEVILKIVELYAHKK